MVFISLLFILAAVGLITWLALQGMNKAAKEYEENVKEKVTQQLSDAFIFFDPVQLWTLSISLAVLGVLLAWLLSGLWVLAVLLGALFLAVPHLFIRYLKQRRQHHFDQQLPDFLLSMSGALKAGAGVQNALIHLSKESIAPLSQELSLMQRQQRMGMSFDETLELLALRMPSEACHLFVSAIRIGSKTGGNLAESMERIGFTVRSRLQIQGRIKALTSQGKMQAWVMCLLPIVLMFVLQHLDPEAMHYLWHSYTGWGVLCLICLLELAGMVMIRKIVNIDV